MFRRYIIFIPLIIIALIASALGCASQPAKSPAVSENSQSVTNPPLTPPNQPVIQVSPFQPPTTQEASGPLNYMGKLVFTSGTNDAGGPQIYTSTANGGNWLRLTSNAKGGELFPKWSPDGMKVAFYSDMTGNNQIFVINADGSNQVQLTNDKANDLLPAWSPDGAKIAFTSDRDSVEQIYIMNADGSNQVRITNNTHDDAAPCWSPDGKKIAFQSDRDGNPQIYVMDADGSNQTKLSSTVFSDDYPAWSPDGSQIVFQSSEPGHFEIYLMKADGSGRKLITSGSVDNKYPAWSPDGTKIVFYSKRDCNNDNGEIYIMNADGTGQTASHSANVRMPGSPRGTEKWAVYRWCLISSRVNA